MSSPVRTVVSGACLSKPGDAVAGETSQHSHGQPLRNRNIGILCNDPSRSEVIALHAVASAMGARVAVVRSDLGPGDEGAALERVARVLARLYDAVFCFDLPRSAVRQLGEAAAMPAICIEGGALDAIRSGTEDCSRLLLARLAGLGA